MSAPRIGDRVSNYLLEELIGTGSFGQVWRAKHHVFDERVAIKIPTNADYVQNLRREGVAIHGLRHPNIVRAIDLDPYGDPPYLIMEYVPGDSLQAMIEQHPKGLPIETCKSVMRGVLKALAVAHQAGVIHRDIKPGNILLTCKRDRADEATEQSVRVADFGLGRIGGLTTHSIMQSGSLLAEPGKSISGTLAYMSPEQREGKEVDGRSDLYSCGVVLFEMLTGERPQGTETPGALRAETPKWLDEVFSRCYARLEKRYANAGGMLGALTVPPVPGGRSSPRRTPNEAEVTDGKPCPSCHRGVQGEDQFCIHCGYQLVGDVPRCGVCNGFVSAADRYCIFCGSELQRAVV